MRTTIKIDNSLMPQAMCATGFLAKKTVVEAGLRLLVKVHRHRSIRRLRGKIAFDDVLNKKGMR